jgi:hypothetical protein
MSIVLIAVARTTGSEALLGLKIGATRIWDLGQSSVCRSDQD